MAKNDGPVESRPGTNPDATDPTTQPDGVTQPPEENKGSGQFAVWDQDLGQYVSGVSDKAGATQSMKDLGNEQGAITDGHKLEVREV